MRMSRLTGIVAATALAVAGALVAAPSASAASAAPAPAAVSAAVAPAAVMAPAAAGLRTPAFYLSLGDSLGFGFSDVKLAEFEQNDELSDFTGYTDDLASQLGVRATNLSCPGETTASMIHGGCPWTTATASHPALPLHASYQGAGSQLAAATAYLSHHRWQHGLITVSIGSNDVLAVAQQCLTNPECPALWPVLSTMRDNLSTILGSLRRAAPFATVVVLAPYNPFGFAYPSSNLAAAAFDLSVAAVTLVHFDRVADAFVPINVRYPVTGGCGNLVYFCTSPVDDDVHPTPAGYAVIAGAFEKALR